MNTLNQFLLHIHVLLLCTALGDLKNSAHLVGTHWKTFKCLFERIKHMHFVNCSKYMWHDYVKGILQCNVVTKFIWHAFNFLKRICQYLNKHFTSFCRTSVGCYYAMSRMLLRGFYFKYLGMFRCLKEGCVQHVINKTLLYKPLDLYRSLLVVASCTQKRLRTEFTLPTFSTHCISTYDKESVEMRRQRKEIKELAKFTRQCRRSSKNQVVRNRCGSYR